MPSLLGKKRIEFFLKKKMSFHNYELWNSVQVNQKHGIPEPGNCQWIDHEE